MTSTCSQGMSGARQTRLFATEILIRERFWLARTSRKLTTVPPRTDPAKLFLGSEGHREDAFICVFSGII